MKLLKSWIAALLVFGFASMANAVPVQYQISGTYSNYYFPGYFPFADGTTVSATFFYDPNTPLTSTDNVDLTGYGDLANYSYYTGSITQLTGSVLNHAFSADSADTLVQNCLPTRCATEQGLVFNLAGNVAKPESAAYSSLQGFTIDDFSLVGMQIAILYPSTFIDQSLPASLTHPHPLISLLELRFENSLGETRNTSFGGQITPVPLPGSFVLFASGLIGLGANKFRKFKK